MEYINRKFSAIIARIASSLAIAGLASFSVGVAADRTLEITDLRLNPSSVVVNQPFEFQVAFKATDSGPVGYGMEATLFFRILEDSKTLFTSVAYPIETTSGKVTTWVTRMNPVSVKGRYTISAQLNYKELNARRSIELVIAEKEIIHLRHILTKTQADAYRVLSGMSGLSGNQLKNQFILEAKTSSVGPTGKIGGDLGMVKRGMMVLEFENAAFSLSPGTITTSPVKTVYGYHIIYREK